MRCKSPVAHSRWWAAFLAAALWVVLYLPITASAAETTTVSMSGPSESLEAGEQFSIGIEVVPHTAIAGMQFDLTFDASLVAVVSVQEGDLLKQGGATSFFNSGGMDNQAGKITGVFGAITTPGMTVSMPGTFATVTFTAKQDCERCPLSLSNVIVGDKEGKTIPISLNNEGSPGGTTQRAVFRWWVLSVIVGGALVLIAATVAGVLFRRRQMVRALQASGNLEPEMRTLSRTSRPQQEVAKASDSVKQRPRLAKCPFCRSTTFHVVEEAGSRRCSDCHAVLPSYVQGNE